MGAELEADVVIVGGGVAGLLAAWRLVQRDVRVLVLEAGPRVQRNEAVATYRRAAAKTPESPYPSVPYAPHPSVLSLKDGYYLQEGEDLFKSTYTRRLGGSTWHWLGTTLRHLPNDFRLQSLYGVGVDWPITYNDLQQWYGEAEKELGVAGDTNADLGSPRKGKYPLPPIPATYQDRRYDTAVAALGYQVQVTPQARNSITYDNRPPCCGNAICVPICPIQAKYDATVHADKVERSGGRIVDRAVVHRIEAGPDGRINAVRFMRPDGSEEQATGRLFILAAHAIETPKLLLISRSERYPSGIANSSDQVGRNLMDHPGQLSWALAREPVYPYRAPLETSGIESLRDGPFRSERAAFRTPIGNDGWSWPGKDPVALAPELIKQGYRGRALRERVEAIVARQLRLVSLIEQLPDPANRITPAWDQPDDLGIPRPRIQYRLGDYVRRSMAEARRFHEQIFEAVGVTEIHHEQAHQGAGHIMGTCRMGEDPAHSVVDPMLRAYDHPNLFILGSSVFPTVGTANPTLTIAALSLRAVEEIHRALGSGA